MNEETMKGSFCIPLFGSSNLNNLSFVASLFRSLSLFVYAFFPKTHRTYTSIHKTTLFIIYSYIESFVQVKFTSDKMQTKLYRWHTGYPGGLKERPAYRMLERNPTQILKKAILGMIPRTKLRTSTMEQRLKVYVGPDHPHTSQMSTTAAATAKPLCVPPPRRRGYFFDGLYADTNTPIIEKKKQGEDDEEEDVEEEYGRAK